MKNKKKLKLFLKYAIGLALAISFFFLTASIRNLFKCDDKNEIIKILSDSFAIPGVLYLGIGLLLIISNLGALNGVSYVLRHAVLMLIPGKKDKHLTYKEYVENRKPLNGFSFIFVIGCLFMLLAIIFAVLYN